MTGKVIVPFIIFFFLFPHCIRAQDRGITVIATENLGPYANIGKQYALFIAIDAYRHWPALKKPVADAREIRDILRRDYYIDEVIELYNQQATKEKIIETFETLQEKLTVHDSLFIYYAGHGHLDNASKQGFWIPVDGGTNRRSQENWLPNNQIRGYIAGLKTIHVFMVNDSCFSGDILDTTRSLPPQIDNDYYRRAYTRTSRQVLTSGASENVPDQSEFSAALINCLRKNTSPLLDPIGIYNDVRLSVRRTTPLYGNLNQANHQEGATFLFFRRTVAPPPRPPVVFETGAATGALEITTVTGGIVQILGIGVNQTIELPAQGNLFIEKLNAGIYHVIMRYKDGKTEDVRVEVVSSWEVTVEFDYRPASLPEPAPLPLPEPAPAREKKPPDSGRLNTLGFSLGTTFAAPVFVGAAQGTFASGRHSFFELGMDVGLGSGYEDIEHISLYPFAHLAFFVPFAKGGGWYAGVGGGVMIATNTYATDAYGYRAGEEVTSTIFAADISTGFIFRSGITFSYTLRTDFATASNKLALGWSYRFK